MWFYYSAIAENGVGNNITAVEYAQTALQMEPNNLQYLLLLQQLKGGQRQYQSGQQSYDSPFGDMSLCYNILLCSCHSHTWTNRTIIGQLADHAAHIYNL